jgi:hypothetical protein
MRFIYTSSLLFFVAASSASAGLIINPIFDSSITSLASAAAIETSIQGAIATFESTYATPITVTIDFESMSGGLGESQTFIDPTNYKTFYNALVATNANAAAIAGLNANGGNSNTNPVTHTGTIDVTPVNLRAVGLAGAPLCNVTGSPGNLGCSSSNIGGPGAVDGIVGVNTALTNPPQPNNGSNFSLVSVVEHEIDEILGSGSDIPNCINCGTTSANNPSPEDLFRYNANGTRSSLTVNCANPGAAFFSYSGTTDLTQFNNACNGADFGDWAASGTPQVQDAFGTPGANPAYGPNETAALSAIGFAIATPEPATAVLLTLSLGALALMKRVR